MTRTAEANREKTMIACDSAETAMAIVTSIVDALAAVASDVPGASTAPAHLTRIGRDIYISAVASTEERMAIADALAVAIDIDETLPEVAL